MNILWLLLPTCSLTLHIVSPQYFGVPDPIARRQTEAEGGLISTLRSPLRMHRICLCNILSGIRHESRFNNALKAPSCPLSKFQQRRSSYHKQQYLTNIEICSPFFFSYFWPSRSWFMRFRSPSRSRTPAQTSILISRMFPNWQWAYSIPTFTLPISFCSTGIFPNQGQQEIHFNSFQNKCLDVQGGVLANGTPVQM